ncbi:aspartyl-phosphate phosphatase Spo0E family protein [Paenibacillus sp. PK3_47]|uniref:aspartyl-phosphate phosphatase Spo0E family protein n=1 Tax=Paenibacillus sp. PK3_47 TaxID=2072642 RepID=UPI00201DF982|nr:aspartyl-phosphate phosphatase Spo0E family protein [Paenibacillus sp. PK3_47]
MPSYGCESYPGSGNQPFKSDASIRNISLEDEIVILRSRMEQMFLQENSFTAANVIEISSLLDLKINEYMKKSSRKG